MAAIDSRGQVVTVRADVATGPMIGEGDRTLSAVAKGVPAGVAGLRDTLPGTFLVSDGTLACAPDCAPHDGVVAADAAVWLVGEPDARVRATRLVLDTASPGVPLERTSIVDLAPHVGPVLVVARATAGVPKVSFGGPVAYGPASAMAVSLGGATTVALSPAVAEPGAKAHLERYAFAAPTAGGLGYGTRDGVVPARGAVAWKHPAGFADLRVTLGEGLVAVLADDHGVVSLLSALDGPATHVVPHGAANITVLSTRDEPVPYTIEATRSSGVAAQLANGVPWEALTGGEIVHLPVMGTGVLHVRGAVSVSANGVTSEGDLAFSTPGEVVLATGRGAVVAWLGESGLMGKEDATFTASSGDAMLVRARGPVVLTGKRADGSSEVRVETEGEPVVFSVQGGAEVRARGLFGARGPTLADVQLLTASPLAEGLGAPVLLGPGDARAFTFETTGEDGAVGLGLAADAEHVRALLFDAAGHVVADGASLMPVLPRGKWLLVVVADDGAPPVTVRPTLVGRDRPGDGPPPEVVQAYLP